MTGKEAMAMLPETIRIGPFDFRIEAWNGATAAAHSEWGNFTAVDFTIRVQEDIPTVVKTVDTFLHELLHAIWWTFDIQDDDKEERTVGMMATALTTVHRDNPWLAPWIEKALSDGHPQA